MAGSRVGLIAEPDAQAHLWSLTSEGFLRYTPTHNLVLDIKGELLVTDTLWTKYVITVLLPCFCAGGHHYDKNLVILSTLDPSRQQQHWDVDVL